MVLARHEMVTWHKATTLKKKVYKSFSLQNVWEKIWDNLLRFPLTVSGKDHMIKKLRVIIIFYHIIYYQGFFSHIIEDELYTYHILSTKIWKNSLTITGGSFPVMCHCHCREKQNEYFLLGNSIYIFYCCNI